MPIPKHYFKLWIAACISKIKNNTYSNIFICIKLSQSKICLKINFKGILPSDIWNSGMKCSTSASHVVLLSSILYEYVQQEYTATRACLNKFQCFNILRLLVKINGSLVLFVFREDNTTTEIEAQKLVPEAKLPLIQIKEEV